MEKLKLIIGAENQRAICASKHLDGGERGPVGDSGPLARHVSSVVLIWAIFFHCKSSVLRYLDKSGESSGYQPD